MDAESMSVLRFSFSPRLDRGSLQRAFRRRGRAKEEKAKKNAHFLQVLLDARVLLVFILELSLRLVVDHWAPLRKIGKLGNVSHGADCGAGTRAKDGGGAVFGERKGHYDG